MRYSRTFYTIGFTFSLILFTVVLGIMGVIIMSGGIDMMSTIHAVPLFVGATKIRDNHRSRRANVLGSTLNAFDGTVFAWIGNGLIKVSEVLDTHKTFEVKMLMDDRGSWVVIQDEIG